MQELGDRVGVGEDASDIARGTERSDDEGAPVMLLQCRLEGGEVDVPITVLGDRHEIGDGFPPWQLIAVVLERPDEDERAFLRRDLVAESVARVEVGRDAEVQDADEAVDRARASVAGEDDAR